MKWDPQNKRDGRAPLAEALLPALHLLLLVLWDQVSLQSRDVGKRLRPSGNVQQEPQEAGGLQASETGSEESRGAGRKDKGRSVHQEGKRVADSLCSEGSLHGIEGRARGPLSLLSGLQAFHLVSATRDGGLGLLPLDLRRDW